MKVGLIGAGNMARAMARGWGGPVLCSDAGFGRAKELADELGGEAATIAEVAERADVVLLAHKPAQLAEVSEQITPRRVVSVLGRTGVEDVRAAYGRSSGAPATNGALATDDERLPRVGFGVLLRFAPSERASGFVTVLGVELEASVRVWRGDVAGGCVCMSGTTTGYAVDPVGEYVVGVVVAGAMRVRRGRERFVFETGDVCTWDPSAAHSGTPHACTSWAARLLILESPALERIVGGPEPLVTDLSFSRPLVRDGRLAQRFVELHRALETPSWALERETLLADWLHDVSDGPQHLDDHRRSARRDPALRRACEFLHDELANNVTLDELERAAGVSRHRLSRMFRTAYDMPPHRFQLAHRIRVARRMLERGVAVAEVAQATGFFDQSHLHRHFRRTLGMTPARYARLTAQTYKTQALS